MVNKSLSGQRPNFLFIGPDKAGSTWLYEALSRHRQAYLPDVKEFFFFDRYYQWGWRWYESYFKDAGQESSVIGEISHDYLFSPLACERIARDLPSVKLMVCLREPAQRAFSAYLYMVKQGRVKTDFDTALREVDELIDHGRYAKHLTSYLETFGRGRIHVAVFDELAEDPQRFFDGVCDFLNIERMPLSAELRQNVLPASEPRSPFWAGLARRAGWQARRAGMLQLVNRVKDSTLVNRLLYRAYQPETKPRMSASAREHLCAEFAPEIERLDALLAADFSSRWGYREDSNTVEVRDSVTPRGENAQ